MKPGFALDLSHDNISLLHRSAQGWQSIGEADLNDPDLGKKLAALRRAARVLAPNGFATKLILPPSQILYFELDAGNSDQAGRRRAIAAALDGRTPYAPEELVFDWSGKARQLQVAVVAKVTLEEAEGFAERHRFNPVSFVTRPAPGSFAGEPFFGLTKVAPKHTPPGERIDRDQDPVPAIVPVDWDGSAEMADPVPEPADTVPSDATAAEPEVAEDDAALESALAEALASDTPDAEAPPADSDANVSDATGEPTLAASPDPVAAEPPVEALPFQSRRSAAPREPDADGESPTHPDNQEAATAKPAEALTAVVARINLAEAETVHIPEANFEAADVAAGGLGITAGDVPFGDAPPLPPNPLANWRDPARAAGLFGRALLKTLPDTRVTRPEIRPGQAPSLAGQRRPEPAAARTGRAPAITLGRGSLRIGAALAAGLIAVFAVIWALWPEPQAGEPAVDSAAEPATAVATVSDISPAASAEAPFDAAPTPPGTAPSSEEAAMAEPADTNALPNPAEVGRAALPELAMAEPGDVGPATVPVPDGPTATAASEVVAEPAPPVDRSLRDVDGSVIWSAAPATATVPAADAGAPDIPAATPGPTDQTAAIMPEVARLNPDPQLLPQPAPPPFGALVRYDAEGFIIPTEDGVQTPEGFTLFAGRPPRVPATRPGAPATEVTPNPLEGKLPRARPEGLVPASVTPPETDAGALTEPDAAAPAETDVALLTEPEAPAEELAVAAPDPALAALKPRTRPAAIMARAESIRAAQAAIEEAAEAARRAEANASALAVATSRRPATRPAAMSLAVEAAIAAAVAEPLPEPEPAPEASATVEIDEPEVTAPAPDLPTSITVSKQATIKNALNLSEVNLIGIYGSAANRRALIRMPNGRYVKVKIGDRIDGGKVAAIGDSELSYVKNGRTIVLKILKNG
ncbi:MAG: hypothetical protein KDE08_02630 [Rhodobacteraceae bacterium]|nr:hypothetical protein [Paracoccaceae bacterium]